MQKAMFAAGCFWGVQFYFDQVPGVTKTVVGYAGGHTKNPTYEEVCSHTTGHAEVTYIEFNPDKITYETLVRQFFRMHDPTQLNRQGPDIGDSYRSSIFYFDKAQKEMADHLIRELQPEIDKPIVTRLEQAGDFWPAEDYHQKFTEKTGRGACHVPYEPIATYS